MNTSVPEAFIANGISTTCTPGPLAFNTALLPPTTILVSRPAVELLPVTRRTPVRFANAAPKAAVNVIVPVATIVQPCTELWDRSILKAPGFVRTLPLAPAAPVHKKAAPEISAPFESYTVEIDPVAAAFIALNPPVYWVLDGK